jgi:hypothetical protein
MSFGNSSYGTGYWGIAQTSDEVAPSRGQVVSSRRIDGKTGEFVIKSAATSDFDGMSDTAQRVYVLICTRLKIPSYIDANFQGKMRVAVESALRPLTAGKEPVIRIENVTAIDYGTATTFTQIDYTDLTTGKRDTVVARR